MKYLAIDTSGEHLLVVAENENVRSVKYLSDCNMKHSVTLMENVEAALSEAALKLSDVDFFVAVVGPGSFTGIRIGVATIKALCYSQNKKALALTSFDLLAYNKNAADKCMCLVDARHDNYYAQSYTAHVPDSEPRFLTLKQAESYVEYVPTACRAGFVGCDFDLADGLINAVEAKSAFAADAETLCPLYVKRCQAEENACE